MENETIENRRLTAVRLRSAREGAGLSQGQVARLLGIHRPTISEIEAARRRVTSDEIAAFARLYGVETWWLAGAAPEETPSEAMAKYEVAARLLSKLDPNDLESLMKILASMKRKEDSDE